VCVAAARQPSSRRPPSFPGAARAAPLHLIGICGNRKKEGSERGKEGKEEERDGISLSLPHSIYLSGGGFIYKCEERECSPPTQSLTHSLPFHSRHPRRLQDERTTSMPPRSQKQFDDKDAAPSISLSWAPLSLPSRPGWKKEEEQEGGEGRGPSIAHPPLPMRLRCRRCRRCEWPRCCPVSGTQGSDGPAWDAGK